MRLRAILAIGFVGLAAVVLSAPDSVKAQEPANAAMVIGNVGPNQTLASKFRGADVVNASETEKIGDIMDILFDQDHKVVAYVISIGGFLGIGSKDVALAPSAFTMKREKQSRGPDRIKLILQGLTKERLKNMPAFDPSMAPQG